MSHEEETLKAAHGSSDSGDRGAAGGRDAFTRVQSHSSGVALAKGMCRSHDAMKESLSFVGPLLVVAKLLPQKRQSPRPLPKKRPFELIATPTLWDLLTPPPRSPVRTLCWKFSRAAAGTSLYRR